MDKSKLFSSKQIKLFKRILADFAKEYTLITGLNVKVGSTKDTSLVKFSTEVYDNLQDFVQCNTDCLIKINLLKNFDPTKAKIQWSYLHSLFLILLPKDKESLEQFGFTKEQMNEKFIESRKNYEKVITKKEQTNAPSFNPVNLISQFLPLVTSLMSTTNTNTNTNNQQQSNQQQSTLSNPEEIITPDKIREHLNNPQIQNLLDENTKSTLNESLNNPNFEKLVKMTGDSVMESLKEGNIDINSLMTGLMSGLTTGDMPDSAGGLDISKLVKSVSEMTIEKVD